MIFVTCLWCVFVARLKDTSAESNTGKEFIIAFMEHIIGNSDLDVYITTAQSVDVSVHVSAPGMTSTQAPVDLTATQGMTAHASISRSLALQGNQKAKKGILISSSADVAVQCFSTRIHSPYSVGGFVAFPTSVLGTEYMVTTYCERNSCVFAVVGTQDDTEVEILIKLPPNKSIKYKHITYFGGDTIKESVDRFEALQFMSFKTFTGTVVRANKKVAVFVGADYTTVRGSSKDAMAEQLAPLRTWGMDYVLAPFPRRVSFDLVIITAQFNNTLVEVNGRRYTIYKAGSSITLELPSLEPAYLWSNKRIFVFQLSTSPQTGKAYSDPSMLAVPPLDQWRSGYTLASVRTSNGAHDAILVLIAKSNCVSQISLRRSNQVTPILWSIAVGDYNISHTELQRGFYSVRSLGQGDCSVFGGYLYGPGNGLAWTMQIGQTFKDLPDNRDEQNASSLMSSASSVVETTATVSVRPSSEIAPSSSEIAPSSSEIAPSSSEIARSFSEIEASTSAIAAGPTTSLEMTSFKSATDILITSSVPSTDEASGIDFISSTEWLGLNTLPATITDSFAESVYTAESTSVYSTAEYNSTYLVSASVFGYSETVTNWDTQTTPTSGVAVTYSSCSCRCKTAYSTVEEIQQWLKLDKNNLSSTKRKYYSVGDNRTTAVAIGSSGVIFVSIALMLLVIEDFMAAVQYISSMLKS